LIQKHAGDDLTILLVIAQVLANPELILVGAMAHLAVKVHHVDFQATSIAD